MIYTLGHSTHKEDVFLKLMEPIDTLIDVRSHPGSRAHPQFNKANMEVWLPQGGKGYIWMPGLGGWDVRHAQNEKLFQSMASVNVALGAYAKGIFPKQRIADHRFNRDMIALQLRRGCNCNIKENTLGGAKAGNTTAETDYLHQLYSGWLEQSTSPLRETQLSLDLGDEHLTNNFRKLFSAKTGKAKPKCLSSILSTLAVKTCESCQKPLVAPQWFSTGLYDYSWFMTLDEFREGLIELIRLGEKENVATCCCEGLWWKCHRSMISDALYFFGIDSVHIMPNSKTKPHSEAISNRIERYPASVVEIWESWKPLIKGASHVSASTRKPEGGPKGQDRHSHTENHHQERP